MNDLTTISNCRVFSADADERPAAGLARFTASVNFQIYLVTLYFAVTRFTRIPENRQKHQEPDELSGAASSAASSGIANRARWGPRQSALPIFFPCWQQWKKFRHELIFVVFPDKINSYFSLLNRDRETGSSRTQNATPVLKPINNTLPYMYTNRRLQNVLRYKILKCTSVNFFNVRKSVTYFRSRTHLDYLRFYLVTSRGLPTDEEVRCVHCDTVYIFVTYAQVKRSIVEADSI